MNSIKHGGVDMNTEIIRVFEDRALILASKAQQPDGSLLVAYTLHFPKEHPDLQLLADSGLLGICQEVRLGDLNVESVLASENN